MGAVGYLYRKTMVNRIKIALRKPVTYFYVALFLFYVLFLPFSLRVFAAQLGGDSPEGMVTVLTVMAFWMIPGNLIAYAKRKGLVYRNSDVHFLFPSPVSPKRVLLYAHLKTLVAQVLMNVFAAVCGGVVFGVSLWRLAVYFVFSLVVENLLEGSIMILLYGSEKLGEKQRAMVVKGAYGLLLVLVAMGVYWYFQEGLSLQAAASFLHSDMVKMVPVVGWYIGVLHLLFLGPDAVNLAVTAAYGILFLGAVLAVWRMKCTGAFYEDAMKFAEDYEEVMKSRKQGDNQKRLGKKQKFGKARVIWKGQGARALFYRQLLEYKKSKYFIFDTSTFMALAAGIGVAYLYTRERGSGFFETFGPFVIPMVSGYLIFVFTALNGKWAKELKSPYTYLIPDSAFRKLMNATAMQHVQSLVNACLITVPGGVVMGMAPMEILLCIVFYVVLSANKLYALAVAEVVVGATLGAFGRQLLQLFIQGIAISAAVVGGVIGMVVGGALQGYLLMDVFLSLFTFIFMVIAALNFYKIETA